MLCYLISLSTEQPVRRWGDETKGVEDDEGEEIVFSHQKEAGNYGHGTTVFEVSEVLSSLPGSLKTWSCRGFMLNICQVNRL